MPNRKCGFVARSVADRGAAGFVAAPPPWRRVEFTAPFRVKDHVLHLRNVAPWLGAFALAARLSCRSRVFQPNMSSRAYRRRFGLRRAFAEHRLADAAD